MSSASHNVTFYGLSTCIHCRHAIEFLNEQGVPFEPIFVDKLEGTARAETLEQVREHNPKISFPTIVVDDGAFVVVGFRPEELKHCLDL